MDLPVRSDLQLKPKREFEKLESADEVFAFLRRLQASAVIYRVCQDKARIWVAHACVCLHPRTDARQKAPCPEMAAEQQLPPLFMYPTLWVKCSLSLRSVDELHERPQRCRLHEHKSTC